MRVLSLAFSEVAGNCLILASCGLTVRPDLRNCFGREETEAAGGGHAKDSDSVAARCGRRRIWRNSRLLGREADAADGLLGGSQPSDGPDAGSLDQDDRGGLGRQ